MDFVGSMISNSLPQVNLGIGDKFNRASQKMNDSYNNLKNKASTGYQNIKNNSNIDYNNIRDRANNGFQNIRDNASMGYQNIREKANTGFQNIRDNASTGYQNMKNNSNIDYNNIRERASNGFDNIRNNASIGYQNIRDNANMEYDNIREKASTGYQNIRDNASMGYDNIREKASTGYQNIRDNAKTGYQNMKNNASIGYDNVKNRVSNGYDNIVNSACNSKSENTITINGELYVKANQSNNQGGKGKKNTRKSPSKKSHKKSPLKKSPTKKSSPKKSPKKSTKRITKGGNPGNLETLCVTFNVGSINFNDSLVREEVNANIRNLFIKTEYPDLIVIGLQESSKEVTDKISSLFIETSKSKAPEGYIEFYKTYGLSPLKPSVAMVVLLNPLYKYNVKSYQAEKSATGSYQFDTLNLTKGGVWTTLMICGQGAGLCKYITFINSHLPSDPSKVDKRVNGIKQLLEKSKTSSNTNIVYMGDLNFRVDNDDTDLRKVPDIGSRISKIKCERKLDINNKEIEEMVDTMNNAQLKDYNCENISGKEVGCKINSNNVIKDQLLTKINPNQYSNELVFGNIKLQESNITFCPSCRYDENDPRNRNSTELYYDGKRVPSWCDRILYWTPKQEIIAKEYFTHPISIKSDHKSVYQRFDIPLN